MKLTEQELEERIDIVRRRLLHRSTPVSKEELDRLEYLNSKEFHNDCSNPECEGYEGTESETICPKCGSELFKLI